MIKPINKNKLRIKRHKRNRKKIRGTMDVPRLYVFKSLKNIYINLVDDNTGNTLASVSTLKTANSDIAQEMAEKARIENEKLAKKISLLDKKIALMSKNKS